jgi:hypothetical protein
VTEQTNRSTLRLSEAARHLVYPAGIVASSYPRIESRLADMAIRYDSWQSGAVRLILGRNAEDRYAATVGGVTMSLPRQVGKTFTIGSLLVALCVEYPGLRVVWTSHHLRTTTNTFRSMQSMVRRKRIFPHLAPNGIRTANGEQEIRFANGSIIMFGAREHGFGVGIDAIDVMVCDEAQRLKSRALADMVPTTNQARHLHGALVIFIGTPPRPDDDGDEFSTRRKKALTGKMTNGIYIEMSADSDAELDDPEQWAKANPSYPHRTPHESMLRLRENLTDDDDWRREAMGIWDDVEKAAIFPTWALLKGDRVAPTAFAIAADVKQTRFVLAGAHGEFVDLITPAAFDGPQVPAAQRALFVSEVARVVGDTLVGLQEKGPAWILRDDLEAAGVVLAKTDTKPGVTMDAFVQACADFETAVLTGSLRHGGQAELATAVKSAAWKTVGDRRVISRKNADIPELEAAIIARHIETARSVEPDVYFI